MSHGRQRKRQHQAKEGLTERRATRALDKLAEFDVFDQTVLPQLKKMVLEGWPPEKIRRAFAPLMQARLIQAGLTGDLRSNATLNALRDTLDRTEGTAIQRVEQKTMYQQLSKRELAALALQKLKDSGIIEVSSSETKTLPERTDEEK